VEVFVLSTTSRLFKTDTESFFKFKEFDNGKWVKPKSSVAFWEVDPREDEYKEFTSETEALKAWKSRLSNN